MSLPSSSMALIFSRYSISSFCSFLRPLGTIFLRAWGASEGPSERQSGE